MLNFNPSPNNIPKAIGGENIKKKYLQKKEIVSLLKTISQLPNFYIKISISFQILTDLFL